MIYITLDREVIGAGTLILTENKIICMYFFVVIGSGLNPLLKLDFPLARNVLLLKISTQFLLNCEQSSWMVTTHNSKEIKLQAH